MAVHRDEEQPDNPINMQSENLSTTLSPNQEKKNMEVHHHAHHDHGKKNWKSYFWEFMMLFLAVFCGFLAEYQLEHKIEGDREEVYIKSMIEDLQKDTANLVSVTKEFQMIDLQLDTFLKMYPKLATGFNDTLWRNLNGVKSFPDFIYSDRTMQQLKNSGAMRLIRNKKVTDGIASYDSNVRDLNDVDIDDLTIHYNNGVILMQGLFDEQNLAIDRKRLSLPEIVNGNKNYLLKSDQASLGEFYNYVNRLRFLNGLIRRKEISLHKEATLLIDLLISEYEIE